jgi:hypothetical protein
MFCPNQFLTKSLCGDDADISSNICTLASLVTMHGETIDAEDLQQASALTFRSLSCCNL